MSEELKWRWRSLESHLVSLSIVKNCCSEELITLLNSSKGNLIKTMNLKTFNIIMFFLLGIINKAERDSMIKWPVMNIATQTKFRKGCVSMVKNLQVKYPWANIVKVPESHFAHPNGQKLILLDFLLGLTSLCIHLVVGQDVFVLADTHGLDQNEKLLHKETLSALSACEHLQAADNYFPIQRFDSIKRNLLQKCVKLKQDTTNVQAELMALKKELIADELITRISADPVRELQAIYDKKFAELERAATHLEESASLGTAASRALKAVNEPVTLCADHFGSSTLHEASNTATDNLKAIHDVLKTRKQSPEDRTAMLEDLTQLKQALCKVQKAQMDFINSCAQNVDIVDDMEAELSKIMLI